MTTIDPRRQWTVEFGDDGVVTDPHTIPDAAGLAGLTDVFVFCHGWNNAPATARELAADMFERVHRLLDPQREPTTGFLTLVWPSLLFPDDRPMTSLTAATSEPGDRSELRTALTTAFPGRSTTVRSVADLLDRRPADQAALTSCVEQLLALAVTSDLTLDQQDATSAPLLGAAPLDAARESATLLADAPVAPDGGVEISSLWSGAIEIARTLSYYAMKARAGQIGVRGLAPLLRSMAGAGTSLRIHLCGHSFGARLVSYALTGLDAASSPVASLVLLQGAFSHFAFDPAPPVASGPGALSTFLDRVHGPMVSTFTVHDRACGWWYPTASLLARQDQDIAAAGDPTYRWGALGHDGYQGAGVVDARIAAPNAPYGFAPGVLTRVESSAVIHQNLSWVSGAHSDIRHDEVAWVMVDAASAGKSP